MIALAPRLLSAARRWTRDGTGADDLVQDTLLRAWRARDRFEAGTNLHGWLLTILRNLYFSHVRRQRHVGTWSDDLERSLSTGEEQSATIELKQTLALVKQLPREQQDALNLVAVEHLSYEHASARSGIPVGTIKSRVTRARLALIGMIEAETPPPSAVQDAPASCPPPSAKRPAAEAANDVQRASGIARWRAAKAAGKTLMIG
ncbi:sigma-70 family RNA polymerase sigma factor [Sphingomonas aracearum]|uniref:sigma-70 family RNA polymerase sigma factor n=1 Tax=Sphingomonas aracearum TaxID=2283317 RepID=UPI0015F03BDC|nr:sigma-70 family RNA polymerase sigma factor [Sphingomonas aracearum]